MLFRSRRSKTSFLESLLNRSPKSDANILSVQGQIISLDQQITVIKSGATYDQFPRVGHSLFALASGLLGGTVAVRFFARQERAGAADRAAPA